MLYDDDKRPGEDETGKSNENQINFIAVADGCESIFTDKLTRHKAVCHIIQMLKYYTSKQRKTKFP